MIGFLICCEECCGSDGPGGAVRAECLCVELLNVGSGVKASRRQPRALVNPIRGSGSIRPQQISHQQIPLQNKHLYNGRRVKTKKLVGEMSGPPSE